MPLLKYALGVGKIIKTTVLGKSTKLSASLIPKAATRENNISSNPAHVKAYNNITSAPAGDEANNIHLMYPAMLTTPLQFEILSSEGFPFPLLGLVHLTNRIQQYDHITLDTKCSVEVYLEDKLILHEKGYVVNMVCEIFCDETKKLLWKSVGGLFHFNKNAASEVANNSNGNVVYDSLIKPEHMKSVMVKETWALEADMGRQYARVSGDYNPIHLSAASAALFGFKKGAIMHGMWTKARTVSSLMPPTHTLTSTNKINIPMAEIFVEFKTPVFLPSSILLCAKESVVTDDTYSALRRKEVVFEVKGAEGEMLPHMRGKCSWNL